MRRQREDGAFKRFYSSVVLQAQQYTSEPVLPRYKRPPKRLDSGVSPHRFVTPQDYYRVQYFEVLDLVSEELTRRFDQASLALPKALEQLLIEASNHPDEMKLSVPEIVVEDYSRDCNMQKLDRQLQMLPDLISTYKTSQNLKSLKVTTVRTLAEMLLKVPLAREIFSESDVLVGLYFTIPVTTATAERSFSALRRIKTYLRFYHV